MNDNNNDDSSDGAMLNDRVPLEADVLISRGGQVEIQTVTTHAVYVAPKQAVYIKSGTSNTDIVNGSLTLQFDLTNFGLGIVQSLPIAYGAVAMRVFERSHASTLGAGLGESWQSRLESIAVFQSMNITVDVELLECTWASKWPQISHYTRLGDYSSASKAYACRQIQLVFENAPAGFPSATVMESSIANAAGVAADIQVDVTVEGNRLEGSFRLSLGNATTSDIPVDATADDMIKALSSLYAVDGVGVTRDIVDRVATTSTVSRIR
eukprot:gene21436-25865_t